jgi:hypothetical protein
MTECAIAGDWAPSDKVCIDRSSDNDSGVELEQVRQAPSMTLNFARRSASLSLGVRGPSWYGAVLHFP